MKQLIYIISIFCLIIVTLLNIAYTGIMKNSEHVNIVNNSFIYILGIILLGLVIFKATEVIDKKINGKNDKDKKKIFKYTIIIYLVINILWITLVIPPIVGDQIHVCNLAQTFYNNNLEQFLPNMTYAGIPLSQYMQSYHQQISLAFVFSLFFRVIHFDGIGLLKVLNVIANVAIVFALLKIVKHLSNKHESNKSRLLFLILTFFSVTMLSTFIYGDMPSIALCLFSTYFMMQYIETKKIKYPIYASLLTMIAYMMRMNSLIFIIATVMYLLICLFKNFTKKEWKEKLINVVVIIMYLGISILPSKLVTNYYLDKYNMDKNAGYPTISYILMAMEESWRGNGWYNEARGEYALKNIEKAKVEYVDEIKNRLEYFVKNPGYTFDFYTKKLASMWTENTYSAVRSNLVEENDPKENLSAPLNFYQKTLLVLMCLTILIFLIQNRKNISNEVIFLLTIFIGGFAFHILWEAKSRYIIPYIIVLIPIASMKIGKIEIIEKIKNKFINLKNKKKG